jgi:hypothetical protein
MADHTTTPKTLWTETLFEILIDALKANKSDKYILEALKDLKQKQLKGVVIVSHIDKKLGKEQAMRIKTLLQKGI